MATRTEYRVVAANPATASENRIHADDVARTYGFRGGLVPGVTVYGYTVHAIVEAFGADWIGDGGADVRFRQPCYEGDELLITVAGDAIEVSSGPTVCVTGQAGRPRHVDHPPVPYAFPPRDKRPPASPDSLAAGTVLGTTPIATDADALAAYLEKVADPSPLYGQRGWLHPGMLLEGANWVLSANVVMPLWLHVGSEVAHVRPARVGEPVEVRGRVAEEWQRRGHRFVRVEIDWAAGDEIIGRARHTAIWQLASAADPG